MGYARSHIAPPRWGLRPELTAAPELWRDCVVGACVSQGMFDYAGRAFPSLTSGAQIIGEHGPALRTSTSNKYRINGKMPTTFGGFFIVDNITLGSAVGYFGQDTNSRQNRWSIRLDQYNNSRALGITSDGDHTSNIATPAGLAVVNFEFSNSSVRLRCNAAEQTISTGNVIPTSDFLDFGNCYNGGPVDWLAWGLYTRNRSSDEHAALERDPFIMFRPRLYTRAASGGTTVITLGSAMNSISAVAGSMNMRPGLSGAATSAVSMASSIDLQQALSGVMTQSSAFSSALDARPGLTGSMNSVSSLSSGIAMQIGFASAMASTSVFSGNLTLAAQALLSLAGTMASTSEFSSTLGLQLHLQSAYDSTSAMQSDLSMTQGMVADLATESGLTGDLSTLIGMAGNLDSAMTFDGAVGLLTELIGTMNSDSSWNGDLTLAAYVLGALIAHGINIRAALDAVFDLHPALNADITLQ